MWAHFLCQRQPKTSPFGGVKVYHFGRWRFVHGPAQQSAPHTATWLGGAVVKPWFGGCWSGLFGLAALLEAVAFAVHFQNMDMMGQPIEKRAGQAL